MVFVFVLTCGPKTYLLKPILVRIMAVSWRGLDNKTLKNGSRQAEHEGDEGGEFTQTTSVGEALHTEV